MSGGKPQPVHKWASNPNVLQIIKQLLKYTSIPTK
jgi:hypothetical protein